MDILDAGHSYLLETLDGRGEKIRLDFVKRAGAKFPMNFGSRAGTNCQEVLRTLIDRSQYLYKQRPCAETEAVIGLLQSALLLFEIRAARRHNRHLDLVSASQLESGTCKTCGHVGCTSH